MEALTLPLTLNPKTSFRAGMGWLDCLEILHDLTMPDFSKFVVRFWHGEGEWYLLLKTLFVQDPK